MYRQCLLRSNRQGNCVWCIWMARHTACWHFICWKQNIFGITFFGLSAQYQLSESQSDDMMWKIHEKEGRIRFLTDFKTFLGNAWGTFLICARIQFHAPPLSLPLWLTYEVWGNTSQLTFYHKFKRQLRSYKVSGFCQGTFFFCLPYVLECSPKGMHFVDIPG